MTDGGKHGRERASARPREMTFSSSAVSNEMQIVRTGELRNRIAKRTVNAVLKLASRRLAQLYSLPYVACRILYGSERTMYARKVC